MSKDDTTTATGAPPAASMPAGQSLLDRYGGELTEMDASDAQKAAFLAALFQIMQAFVDLGFSIKPGEKFAATCDIGMDDVLEYLIPVDTAHETVAPQRSTFNNGEAQ